MHQQHRREMLGDENDEDVSGIRDMPQILRDGGLTQWKQERLALHHAYFARLDKAFTRWKLVTYTRRQRRQRVIAACRIGAKFFQRLYWEQWIDVVVRRRVARERASQILHTLAEKIRLRSVWIKWKKIIPKELSLADRMPMERQFEVRGARLQKTVSAPKTRRELPVQTVSVDPGLRTERVQVLKKINVYYTQRHHFQLWRKAAKEVTKAISQQLRHKADAFRMDTAFQRWRRGFTSRSEYKTSTRQAIFFLYYHLTKSSMVQLRRHANRQRQERSIVVVISNRVRRRKLNSVFSMWRQRLNTKLVFSEWRHVVQTASTQPRNPRLRVVRDIVRGLETHRLLHRCFVEWIKQSALKRRSRALAHILDNPMSKVALTKGFRRWKRKTFNQKEFEDRVKAHDRQRLLNAWQSWTHFAKEKEAQELKRRKATRYWYYRTLRRSFAAMQTLCQRHHEVDAAVETMAQVATMRRQREIFERWSSWWRFQRRCREAVVVAHHFREQSMKRRVLYVFKCIFEEAQGREVLAMRHAHAITQEKLQRAFHQWRSYCVQEQQKGQVLQEKLSSYLQSRTNEMKRLIFKLLEDHAKSKQASRLVSAHARGHFQSTLLRHAFSKWVTSVTQLKWEHIFIQRARHFRNKKLAERCFHKWKWNVLAIRRHRAKTRLALHHWKKVRELVVFECWKHYVTDRRQHRQRMHEALEFRHCAHIREGLSLWIEGSTHITQQRKRRTAEMQATHTQRVWNKVREIAAHWRYIAHRNKHRQNLQQQLHIHEQHVIPHTTLDEDNEANHQLRWRHDRLHGNRDKPAIRMLRSRHHDHDSELSEFVILPRKRPRPRKPIELILNTDLSTVCIDHSGVTDDMKTDQYRAIDNVNRQYGFQFPLEATTIVDKFPCTPDPASKSKDAHFSDFGSQGLRTLLNAMPQESDMTIDELEQRLLQWQTRRQRLKQLQNSLEEFRRLLHQASNEGSLPRHQLEHMEARLSAMEQQEAASRSRWNESRPEILALAHRIKLLRGTTSA